MVRLTQLFFERVPIKSGRVEKFSTSSNSKILRKSYWFEMPAKVIASTPKLKMIAVAATGYEWVDLDEARKRKIVVSNSPGYSAEAVAEHTIGLLLNAIRQSSLAQKDVKNKIYDPLRYVGGIT